MKIKFSSDSTCDMPKHFVQEFDVSILPLIVTLGENEYLDGVLRNWRKTFCML